jgi:hypothetical protein
MTHPITELLEKQAAFEARLPNRKLFSGNTQTVRRKYHDVISLLALDCLGGPIDSVPRAMIAILGASLALKFDLAAGFTKESPETANETDFTKLTRTVAQSYPARPSKINQVHDLGLKFIASAAHYGSESSQTYNDKALSLLARDESTLYSSKDRKRIFTNALVYSMQDLLGFIGMVDANKKVDFSAQHILKSVDTIYNQIAPPSIK